MQSPLMDASRTLFKIPNTHSLGFLPSSSPSSNLPPTTRRHRIYCKFSNPNNNRRRNSLTSAKGKDNVWSVDNDAANGTRGGGERRRKGRKKVKSNVAGRRKKGSDDGVMVSGPMLIETENVLQTQLAEHAVRNFCYANGVVARSGSRSAVTCFAVGGEWELLEPVIIPIWNTFTSSVSGIWKGVGAVFSPITAQMEPIEVGRNNEHQFDCYTLSRIEAVPPTNRDDKSHIRRTVNWVTLNPYGENRQLHSRENKGKEMSVEEDASLPTVDSLDGKRNSHVLPKFESFDFEASDVMEEDLMGMEPGLVFFEVKLLELLSAVFHISFLLLMPLQWAINLVSYGETVSNQEDAITSFRAAFAHIDSVRSLFGDCLLCFPMLLQPGAGGADQELLKWAYFALLASATLKLESKVDLIIDPNAQNDYSKLAQARSRHAT
ncbi:calycin-like protein [Tanacetum coccineum]